MNQRMQLAEAPGVDLDAELGDAMCKMSRISIDSPATESDAALSKMIQEYIVGDAIISVCGGCDPGVVGCPWLVRALVRIVNEELERVKTMDPYTVGRDLVIATKDRAASISSDVATTNLLEVFSGWSADPEQTHKGDRHVNNMRILIKRGVRELVAQIRRPCAAECEQKQLGQPQTTTQSTLLDKITGFSTEFVGAMEALAPFVFDMWSTRGLTPAGDHHDDPQTTPVAIICALVSKNHEVDQPPGSNAAVLVLARAIAVCGNSHHRQVVLTRLVNIKPVFRLGTGQHQRAESASTLTREVDVLCSRYRTAKHQLATLINAELELATPSLAPTTKITCRLTVTPGDRHAQVSSPTTIQVTNVRWEEEEGGGSSPPLPPLTAV